MEALLIKFGRAFSFLNQKANEITGVTHFDHCNLILNY